ncbi:MAG TPA: peptide chain release factor 1 [Pirellulaceae bacterium]|jgi:peptide chain release factor 1|nr:peptide chain release factor 1 [Pirellulaceae bacterium]
MREMLEQKLARFEELEHLVSDPSALPPTITIADAMREHGSLAKLATKYRRYKQLNRELAELKELLDSDDADAREMAEEEQGDLRVEREKIWDEILGLTIGGEDAMRTRIVMEIRAGAGGDEAALFAGDLYEMYKRFGDTKGWKIELLEASPTELGGFKSITLGVEGDGVFRELQYESGGHRVQRVPATEAKGRIHTSAATVAVLPEPEDVEVDLKPDDYRKDLYTASGPGGQHVNKTESAVRLTHLETNIVVAIQDEKSQHKNLAKALRILKSRVYEHYRMIEDQKRSAERKTLVGSGDRSQRIRTYNYPENRVTHHSIGFKMNLDQVMVGNLQPIIDALIDASRAELRGSFEDAEAR